MSPDETQAASIRRGIEAASAALADLSGGRASIEAPQVRRVKPADVMADLGAADRQLVGVYVGFAGGQSGHALLLMTPDGAERISRHLLADLADGSAHDDNGNDEPASALAASALEELGNVVISKVLNELGRGFAEPIHPTVPQAVTDMAGAILDGILVDLVVDRDDLTLAQATFTESGDVFDGWLLVLPRPVERPELVASATPA